MITVTGKLILVAMLNGQPALVPVNWTVDGEPKGEQHSMVLNVETGMHEACAQYGRVSICRRATVDVNKTTTLVIGVDG